MSLVEHVKAHWGKVGCSHCSKPPKYTCECYLAAYCGTECQQLDKGRHTLICGKGDGEELPSMEKVVPKDVLDLLVPYMRGADLTDFSESSQAAMVAYRKYTAAKTNFNFDLIDPETLRALSPWISNVTAEGKKAVRMLLDWPAKYLIQSIRVQGQLDVRRIAEFHNLKELDILFHDTDFDQRAFISTLPETLTSLKMRGTMFASSGKLDVRHLRGLQTLFVNGIAKGSLDISLPGPLLELVMRNQLGIRFTEMFPVRKLTVDAKVQYPLDGCDDLTVEKGGMDEMLVRIGKSKIRSLTMSTSARANEVAFPPTLNALNLLWCGTNGALNVPDTVQVLQVVGGSVGRINLGQNIQTLELEECNTQELNVQSLDHCTSFVAKDGTLGRSVRNLKAVMKLLNPRIVKKLELEIRAEKFTLKSLRKYTALEELKLGGERLKLKCYDWKPPKTLRILHLERVYIHDDVAIERLPEGIQEVMIYCPGGPKSAAYFLKKLASFECNPQTHVPVRPPLPALVRFQVILDGSDYNPLSKDWTYNESYGEVHTISGGGGVKVVKKARVVNIG